MIATRHSVDDGRVFHKETKSLAAAGHEITLLTCCNGRHEYTRLDGSVAAKGAPPSGSCTFEGISVMGRPKRRGLSGRLRTYFELSELAAGLKAEVYHAHEPDMALAIALRAKRILKNRGSKTAVVHDMHEYPPAGFYDEAASLLKMPIFLAHALWDLWTSNYVDHVFTANSIVRGYALVLRHRIGVDILYNGPSLGLFPQLPANRWNGHEKLILCHEGSLSFDRGLREMIEAIDHLQDRVCLHIVGEPFGAEAVFLREAIERRHLQDTVMCTGWLPYRDVGKAIRRCHAGLILFRSSLNNRMAGPPNKFFNYMNAGLAVLAVDFPELYRIIGEERCGVLIRRQTVEAIVEGIEMLLADPEEAYAMGQRGQAAIRERYSWEVMERKLLSAYERLSEQF